MDQQAPMEQFQQYLAEDRLMLQRGRESGKYFFYPRTVEPVTGSTDWEWVQVSGLGTVYSTTVVRQKPPKEDYNLALIDLDEGPRMLSRVEGVAPTDVRIGMRVSGLIIREEDNPVLVFKPASSD